MCRKSLRNIKSNCRLPLQSRPVHEGNGESAIVLVHDHVHGAEVTERVRLRSEDLVRNDTVPYGVERRSREYGVA